MQEGSHSDIADGLFARARLTISPDKVAPIKRYGGLNAAIQMLGSQAHRFGAPLLADAQLPTPVAFEIIEHLAALRNSHGNKGVRKTADTAVTLVLQEVVPGLGVRS